MMVMVLEAVAVVVMVPEIVISSWAATKTAAAMMKNVEANFILCDVVCLELWLRVFPAEPSCSVLDKQSNLTTL